MTLLPSATDFSTVESTNESLSACGRKTPAASNKGSATLATECARPAMGSPFRTLFPFAVAVLKWCPRAVSAVPLPGFWGAPRAVAGARPRRTPAHTDAGETAAWREGEEERRTPRGVATTKG